MLFKASKKAPYLYRHNNSPYYYFRRSIPAALRLVIGKREIKVSLKTSNKAEAILLHNKLNTTVAEIFACRDGTMIRKLEISSITKSSDGSVKIEGLKTDPTNPEGDLAILERLGFGFTESNGVIIAEPTKQSGMRFSELVVKYLHHAKLNSKTKKQDEAILSMFMELYDDPSVAGIDHPMMTNFVETIERYIPANAKKMYPKLTAKQISKLNHSGKKMMSAHSVNKYLGRVGLAFKYAVNHGYMKENFAHGKRIKDLEHARDKRQPFSSEEIEKILNKSEKDLTNKPDLYWLLWIGAYTGMRLGEICQLQPQDLRQEDDIWVIDINKNHELKDCKTSGSERLVPVHSALIENGLLEYVASRKREEFLFSWKYHEDHDWSYNSSKDSKYFIETKSGISGKSFHCFRHTVADNLMKSLSATITKEVIAGILGHSQQGETFGRYGKGFNVKLLQDAVEAIRYKST